MEGSLMYQLFMMLFTSTVLTKGEDLKVGPSLINNHAINNFIKEKNLHFLETFNDKETFKKHWIVSEAKKEGLEGDLAKYDGDWFIGSPTKHQLQGDNGLSFKQRAKHRAISAILSRDFEFVDKPFVLQYEVLFQDGQECGGGYVKLITGNRDNINLKDFHDKTPYTIMFGPDKCGSTSKVHFIFRHKNPLNGSFEEKHCKPVTSRIDEIFTDNKPHLFGLVILPDNKYKILLDHKIINEGSLLTDFTPPVNPPAEVDDPTDTKPADWDDREHIPDPDATKPDDWDETEPHMIPDPTAVKPENWLDNEPLYIRDPLAEKPHDWDVEMDGEWEAPLVPNPACEDAGGCGDWTPPKIHNPAYKGKWTAPIIPNPNYKGKWTPKKIPNVHFFEDNHPFKMEKIVAVGFELWSMSPNILFDNVLVTDSESTARRIAELTFDVKMLIIEQSADTMLNQFVAFTNKYPWLWAVYTVILLILVTLVVYCCFSSFKDNSDQQRPDRPQPDGSDDSAPLLSEEQEAENGDAQDVEGERESVDSCDYETGDRPVADGGDQHEVVGETVESPIKDTITKDSEDENLEVTERPDGDDESTKDSSVDTSGEGTTEAQLNPEQHSADKESKEGANVKKNE